MNHAVLDMSSIRHLVIDLCRTVRVQNLHPACVLRTKRPESHTQIAKMTKEGVS